MTRLTRHQTIGYSVAVLGVLWFLGTVALELWLHVAGRPELPIHLGYVSLSAGLIVGWWGFFWANSKRAKEGGTYVIDAADRIEETFHAHRRRTDPPAPIPPEIIP